MAVAAYYQWDSLGRPLEPAKPIRDIVERMKVAYPKAASTFSWYANQAHYTAVPPQDHTPFSATGWPKPSPEWWVFATDIMHNPSVGVDCNALFAYWIAEARAGRMPWLKYLIWQAKLYDVRNAWKPQANSGHFDHIHISTRTDFKDRGLGSWSIVPRPPEVADMPKTFIINEVVNGPQGPIPANALYASGGSGFHHIKDATFYGQTWGFDPFANTGQPMPLAEAYRRFGPFLGEPEELIVEPGPEGPPGPATLVPHTHGFMFDGTTGPAVAE